MSGRHGAGELPAARAVVAETSASSPHTAFTSRSLVPVRAMVLDSPSRPLREAELPEPEPGPGRLRVRVEGCAVCRTDLHIVDGELPGPKLPLVLGHQIVGVVDKVGEGAEAEPGS